MIKRIAPFIFFVISVSSCGLLPKEEEPLAPPVISAYESAAYQFAAVKRDTLTRLVDASASKVPAHEEEVAFKANNILITQVYAETGGTVKKGDILALLDKSDLERRLDDAYFSMSQLELRRKHTEETYLLSKKYASVAYVDDRAFERTMADIATRIQILQIDVEKILERIEERTLLATMDGTVTFVKKTGDGDRSVEKERFATITDTTVSVFIITGANAQYFAQGDVVLMRVSGSDFFEIKVSAPEEIGVVDPDPKAAYFALADVPAEYMNARYATVRYIIEEKEDVLCLPNQAINSVGAEKFVYVLNENVREQVIVETGMEAFGGFTEIISGLEEGDNVILP